MRSRYARAGPHPARAGNFPRSTCIDIFLNIQLNTSHAHRCRTFSEAVCVGGTSDGGLERPDIHEYASFRFSKRTSAPRKINGTGWGLSRAGHISQAPFDERCTCILDDSGGLVDGCGLDDGGGLVQGSGLVGSGGLVLCGEVVARLFPLQHCCVLCVVDDQVCKVSVQHLWAAACTERTPRHPVNGDAGGAEGGDDSGQQRGAMWSGPDASTPVRSARKKCSPTHGFSFLRPTLSRKPASFPCRCARPCRCASSLWRSYVLLAPPVWYDFFICPPLPPPPLPSSSSVPPTTQFVTPGQLLE